MAVKVMVASAIARARSARGPPRSSATEPRPSQAARRSSVYDADGNEVFITLMCLKCHKMRPLSQFGLRKMADGAIRNQPWCRTCRSGAGREAGARGRRSRGAGTVDGRRSRARAPRPRASARRRERRRRGRGGACRRPPLINRPGA